MPSSQQACQDKVLERKSALIEQAFRELYPEKHLSFTSSITYTKQFSSFNANIRKHYNHIEVRMSHLWKDIGKEIQMGLIQSLAYEVVQG